MSDDGCRCVSHDAAECARIRYRRDYRTFDPDVCDCRCHEADDEGFDDTDEPDDYDPDAPDLDESDPYMPGWIA